MRVEKVDFLIQLFFVTKYLSDKIICYAKCLRERRYGNDLASFLMVFENFKDFCEFGLNHSSDDGINKINKSCDYIRRSFN